MKAGIVQRLRRALIALALLPLFFGSFLLLGESFTSQKNQLYETYQRRADALAREVHHFFQRAESDLSLTHRFWSFEKLPNIEQERILLDIAAHNDAFNQIAFLGPDGNERVSISTREFTAGHQTEWRSMTSVTSTLSTRFPSMSITSKHIPFHSNWSLATGT